MPYWNLKGNRESNTLHSENYKSIIEEYMNVNGYIKQSDSGIHGCLSDMIFKNREFNGDVETHIEAKWDSFSLKNKSMRDEFTQYALLYLHAPEQAQFKFMIFAKNISSDTYHRAIFEKHNQTEITSLYEKILDELSNQDKKFFRSASIEKFRKFLWDTTLIKADLEDLKMKILQLTNNVPLEEDLHLRYQNLIDESPVKEELDTIYSNLIEIPKLKYLWSAKTSCLDEADVRTHIPYPPPHHFYSNRIISFYPFEDYNELSQIIERDSIERIDIQDWIQDRDKSNIIRTILNKTIKKLCQLVGLYKTQDSEHIFYFPNLNGADEQGLSWTLYEKVFEKDKWAIKKRECPDRKIYKKLDRFHDQPFLHIGVQISALILEKKLYFSFLPRKVFTKDGKEQVESKRARVLEQSFRDPMYSYNRNLLLEQLFWGYILFLNPNLKNRPLPCSNPTEVAKKNHIIQILQILGLDYFTLFQNRYKPVLQDDNEIDETDRLNSLFNYCPAGDDS